MAKQDYFGKVATSVMERFNAAEITRCQAQEELLALILASKTVGNLELAHNAYDSVAEGRSQRW